MTLSYLVPIRDDKRLMDDAIPIDNATKEISVRDLLECYLHACRDDKLPGYRKFLSNNFTNISTKMKLSRHDITTDKWSLTLDGFRGKLDDNRTVASFYVNGGKIENKVAPYATFKLVAGSEIEFRPPPQYRKLKFMRHLKFMVVADDGVEKEEEEEEEEEAEVVVAVDADAADDVVEDVEEAEVVVVVDANDGDGDEEAVEEEEEQSIPAAVDEEKEEEEIEELTVKSPNMLIQERQDLAEESGKVITLLDTPDKTTATIVVDEEEVEILPSFEEIRSIMGFSPINDNPTDPVPHDEDLMGWHSPPKAPPPSRRSIYDPIQIN